MAIAAPDIGGGTNTKLAAALAAQKKVLANVACKRHNLRKRPQKMKRQARGTMVLAPEAQRLAKQFFPYGG